MAEERRAGIDESGVKAANERMEDLLEVDMDRLNLQKHRRRADTDYEIEQVREDVRRWERIQSLLGQDFVLKAMEMRRQVRMMYGGKSRLPPATDTTDPGATSYDKPRTARPKTSQSRPEHPVDMPPLGMASSRPVHSKSASSSAQAHRQPRAAWPPGHTADSTWITSPSAPSGGPTLTPPRRPKTALATTPHRPARDRQKRAKTALGFHHIRGPSDSITHTVVPTRKPGRSFAELRDLTDIEKISEDTTVSKRDEVLQVRNHRHVEERCDIERRIQLFYEDIDDFKRRNAPKKDYTHIVLDAW